MILDALEFKKALDAGFNYTHPCNERKDGAPSYVEGASRFKSMGHPPTLYVFGAREVKSAGHPPIRNIAVRRDSVPFLLSLPRTYVRGYIMAPLRGWGRVPHPLFSSWAGSNSRFLDCA